MSSISRRAAALLSFGCLAATLTGCLNDPIQGDKTIDGRYVVASVNDAALPVVLSTANGSTVELVRESLTLFQGGTFVDSSFLRTTTGAAVALSTTVESGAFGAGLGTSVVFTSPSRQRTLLYTANTLTHTDAGITRVYRK